MPRINLPSQPDMLPTDELWIQVKDGNKSALALFNRHYSAYDYKDGRNPVLFVGPGEKMVLISPRADALFVWRKFIDASGQDGVNCAVFRNEGRVLSSSLILDAEIYAYSRWGDTRAYTYVNQRMILSNNPGYCFIVAGWKRAGFTKARNLLILEKTLNHAENKNIA